MDSWSKYTGVVDMGRIEEARAILTRGNEINQMMKVVGEEGTSAEDTSFIRKANFLMLYIFSRTHSIRLTQHAHRRDRDRNSINFMKH